MKICNDFVSNSSSCSFLIYLKTDDDVKQFNNIVDILRNDFGCSIYAGITYDPFDMSNTNGMLEKDTWVSVDVGDDTLENIDKLYDIEGFIDKRNCKFKIFKDELAHYTFGEELQKDNYEQ